MCGQLIEIVRDDNALQTAGDKDIVVEPDDILQFVHRTVKDFLEDPKRAGSLWFSESSSVERVRDVARTYVQVAFPTEPVLYAPIRSSTDQSNWHSNIQKFLVYLNDRILLPFVLTILSDAFGICCNVFDYSIHPDLKSWNKEDIERAFSNELSHYFWLKDVEDPIVTLRTITFVYCFHCPHADRLDIATKILYTIILNYYPHQYPNGPVRP